jgi:hypothetical protein
MMEMNANVSARPRTLPARDARGRFVAVLGAASETPRARALSSRDDRRSARVLPSRDARGRFVSFPTTSAPSWYVFCSDGYRIPGHAEVMAMIVEARPAPEPQPLPPARAMRRHRPAMQWDEIATWMVMAIFVVVVGWRMLHLQLPHH